MQRNDWNYDIYTVFVCETVFSVLKFFCFVVSALTVKIKPRQRVRLYSNYITGEELDRTVPYTIDEDCGCQLDEGKCSMYCSYKIYFIQPGFNKLLQEGDKAAIFCQRKGCGVRWDHWLKVVFSMFIIAANGWSTRGKVLSYFSCSKYFHHGSLGPGILVLQLLDEQVRQVG